ncbi:helix-turn-helix transcriptional regulator [Fusobacterium polymorphum]
MEDKIKKLGNYIDNLREERKLGFNQLSKKSGVNPKSLNDIIYGKSKRINPFYLIKLAKALKIHYKELYKIIGYLLPEDDIIKIKNNKKINTDALKNENLLDLSMLNEQDAKSIQNIYESLIQLKNK